MHSQLNILLVRLFVLLFGLNLLAQDSTDTRLKVVGGATLLSYTGTMISLGAVWYDGLGKFHFFNDNDGWNYMDKIGHVTAAQQIGRGVSEAFIWAGLETRKSVIIGGMTAFTFLTTVEIFDGMSEDWGFSLGDMAANALGTALFMGQELTWEEQRVILKWSYHSTTYAQYRPELLGRDWSQQWLKDYNGQTYWLSANIRSFAPGATRVPNWLNVAVGYGIDGFTGANRNPSLNAEGETIPPFLRSSQFYFSPDVDLSRIQTGSPWINRVLGAINFVKVPLPALVYSEPQGIQWRWFYF